MADRPTSDAKRLEQILAEYPIEGLVDGWYFRQNEVSAGAYLIEGCDLRGRTVTRYGSDPEALLTECAADARCIKQRFTGSL